MLAVIPARGGSKGVPGKNIRKVGGRPMIAYSVAAARGAKHVDRVIVSTDDDSIASAATDAGAEVPFRRPHNLATDEASTVDVVVHALEQCPGHGVVVLLQPTSPLRTAADIDAAMELFVRHGADSCVSVREAVETPYWMFSIEKTGRLHPVAGGDYINSQRQALPSAYVLNGAIYISAVPELLRRRSFLSKDTVGYVMPMERSLDIDTETDFAEFAKLLGECSHA